MRSSQRLQVIYVVIGITLVSLAATVGVAQLAAESPTREAAEIPLIHSGQTPRLQDFFSGGDASFTVTITNTGSVAFQAVTVTDATTADCNRDNLGALAPGATTSYTCGADNVTESFLNELQVNGTTDATTVSHRTNAFVKVLKQELRITKTPQFQTIQRGATAFFTITLFNTSDFIMQIEKVDDTIVDTCDRNPIITVNLEPGESLDYPCVITGVQNSFASVATVQGKNPVTGNQYTASDAAWVDVLGLEAELTPLTTSVPEPGDHVTFTVDLTNTASLPLTLVGLTTNQFGNILDPSNPQVEAESNTCLPQPALPILQPFGGSYSCSFKALVSGQPSDFSVILTATAKDDEDQNVTATTSATVVISNTPATMHLSLSADPAFINPPSRLVEFSVRVDNTSVTDSIDVTEIEDEFLGDLNGKGSCELPVNLLPGYSYQCYFSAMVSGQIGDQKSRTISVTAVNDDLTPQTLNASDVVTVNVTELPAQAIFMPNVTDDSVEPNNSCSRAYPLSLNRPYSFFPPNKYDSTLPLDQRDQDYFSFVLPQSGKITVELTNFAPRKGQLIVRPHVEGAITPCGDPLGRNPDEGLNKTVALGTQPPGRYYIQLINDGPSNVRELYTLLVKFVPEP